MKKEFSTWPYQVLHASTVTPMWRFAYGTYTENQSYYDDDFRTWGLVMPFTVVAAYGEENMEQVMRALRGARRRRRRVRPGVMTIYFSTGSTLKGKAVWNEVLAP